MVARKERWGSRVGLILAMAGNAVGLGNFLRFPAQAIQNGGGAFILPYLICFVLMGIPLVWVEWAIGRHGGRYGHHSTPGMFQVLGTQRWLKYIGVLGLFASITVAGYYVYIESWALAYVWHSAVGTFATETPGQFFGAYVGSDRGTDLVFPAQAIFWFLVTVGLNVLVLSRGLAKGIELAAKIGLPLLILFAGILVVRGLTLTPGDPGVIESPLTGLNFIWEPRFSGLWDPSIWLAAAGQVFFTLSLGMGSVHCYASYLRANEDIALNAASAGWLNEFVEVILGGSLIIPIATAYLGLNAVLDATSSGSGFNLGFLILPTLFQGWGWFAPIAGVLWFGLLFFAGITSSLAMGQSAIAFLEDELQMDRRKSALGFGGILIVLGAFCILFYPGGSFDEFDFWSGTFVLVLFALLESVIFSYLFGIEKGWEEINRGAQLVIPKVFKVVLRFITPALLCLVFIGALFKPEDTWTAALESLVGGTGWTFSGDSVIGRVIHSGYEEYRWVDQDGSLTRAFVQDGTRAVLTLLFLGICVLVWWALSRNRRNQGDGQ
ncbi:MAG: sodium-dependent transporter [Acidobacteriota bacterium]|nr:MAG: sodium-dependent transporter [Acidobacteriota bacterium]